MTTIVKYTNVAGETSWGILLSWPQPGRGLAEVFWDKMRHPVVKELRVIYQCTIPHERDAEIAWVRIQSGDADGGHYSYELLASDSVKVKWECPEIVKILNSSHPKEYIAHLDRGLWASGSAAKFVEKDFKKHAAIAKETLKDETD